MEIYYNQERLKDWFGLFVYITYTREIMLNEILKNLGIKESEFKIEEDKFNIKTFKFTFSVSKQFFFFYKGSGRKIILNSLLDYFDQELNKIFKGLDK